LRELCNDVVALRREDHSAARLKIEQARLERESEETEEEAVAYFQRCAQNPKVRAAICGGCVSPEEREQRMRAIFGLAPAETAKTIHPVNGAAAGAGNCDRGESSPIKADQAEPVPPAVDEAG